MISMHKLSTQSTYNYIILEKDMLWKYKTGTQQLCYVHNMIIHKIHRFLLVLCALIHVLIIPTKKMLSHTYWLHN